MNTLRERLPNKILEIKIFEWSSNSILLAISDNFQKYHICELFSNSQYRYNCPVQWSFDLNSEFLKINLESEFGKVPEFFFTAVDGMQYQIICEDIYLNFDFVDYSENNKPQPFERLEKNIHFHRQANN